MQIPPLLPILLLAAPALLAGCVVDPAAPAATEGSVPAEAAAVPTAWPPLEDAVIRPGVRVGPGQGTCTSNFVFASPDNATLYLGLAAHCVGGMNLGDAVPIAAGAATGALAYSSRLVMNHTGGDIHTPLNPPTCDEAFSPEACEGNDFALLRLDEADRPKVHPALLALGGPTGLADSQRVALGTGLLTYGNSTGRSDLAAAKPREGLLVERANDWTSRAYFRTPAIPGDSGSAVLDAEGRAAGVVITLEATPPASTGITHLDQAIAFAREHAGLDVVLATWPLLARDLPVS